LQTGDRVDVYGGFSSSGTGSASPVLRLLVPGALVLKAPAAAGGGGLAGGGSSVSNVVLEIDQSLAPALAFAADNGKVWLVLRPANATNPTQTLTNLTSILGTSSTLSLHPGTVTSAPGGATSTTAAGTTSTPAGASTGTGGHP
jgi:Flp pilus assembly protein CpaB